MSFGGGSGVWCARAVPTKSTCIPAGAISAGAAWCERPTPRTCVRATRRTISPCNADCTSKWVRTPRRAKTANSLVTRRTARVHINGRNGQPPPRLRPPSARAGRRTGGGHALPGLRGTARPDDLPPIRGDGSLLPDLRPRLVSPRPAPRRLTRRRGPARARQADARGRARMATRTRTTATPGRSTILAAIEFLLAKVRRRRRSRARQGMSWERPLGLPGRPRGR